MRGAKIKVWMLTGDKLETAENIGLSCKLLDYDKDFHIIRWDIDNLEKEMDSFDGTKYPTRKAKMALLIEGKALTMV
jgi:magnesium-transporting ATPase (P-type)